MTDTKPQPRKPKATAIEVFVVLLLLYVGFRLLSVALLLLTAALYFTFSLHRSRRWLIGMYIAFFVSLVLPIDVDFGGLHQHYFGRHFGERRSGPRFVRLVMGMPRIRHCVAQYGEFISGGCVT